MANEDLAPRVAQIRKALTKEDYKFLLGAIAGSVVVPVKNSQASKEWIMEKSGEQSPEEVKEAKRKKFKETFGSETDPMELLNVLDEKLEKVIEKLARSEQTMGVITPSEEVFEALKKTIQTVKGVNQQANYLN